MLSKFGLPRDGKKLLVLDIDHTLGDLCSRKFEHFSHVRPYFNKFLSRAYKYYDIVLWSAVDMNSLMAKMNQLRVLFSENYQILCCLDENEMVSAIWKSKPLKTKDLSVIWNRYPQYNQTNTIICDDQKTNYINNIANGIEIKYYKFTNYGTDNELKKLANYIEYLAKYSIDFSKESHLIWRKVNV